jgi:hypothetical protein
LCTTTDFIAGGGNVNSETNVGTVEVCNDGAQVTVTYTIEDDDWCLDETHLAIKTAWTLIPQTKTHNPIPGQFPLSETGLGCASGWENTVTLDGGCNQGNTIYIAAHGVVKEAIGADLDYLRINLPDTVQMTVSGVPGPTYGTYFDLTILNTDLAGTYADWCIDTDLQISPGTTYTANVYSTYGENYYPTNLEFPGNFDKLNYLINNYAVGGTCGGNTLSWKEIQTAIWHFMEDSTPPNVGANPTSVTCIVDDVEQNGEGFVPTCGEKIAIILEPISLSNQITVAQITIGELDIAQCIYQDETAWGDGTEFAADRGWATYFTHTCC